MIMKRKASIVVNPEVKMESLRVATINLGGKNISGRVRNLNKKDLTITQLGYAS